MNNNLNITLEQNESILDLGLDILVSDLNIDIVFGGSSGVGTGSGHTILSSTNTFPQRSNLRFTGAYIIDNQASDITEVSGFKGDKGDIGPIGPKGDVGDTGVSGINYLGEYNPNITYYKRDCVRSSIDGNAYYCIVDAVFNSEPSTDPSSWSLFVMKGAPGDKGEDGKTAYESAIDGGFIGSESEFNEDLSNLTISTSDLTSITVGGLKSGTNLFGKTAVEALDIMLYPELFPTLTAPSFVFNTTKPLLQEIGTSINLDLTSWFNMGSILPQYKSDSSYRSGLPISFLFSGPGISGILNRPALGATIYTETLSNYIVLLGTNMWTGSINYSQGVVPLSNKGNYMPGATAPLYNALPAGTITQTFFMTGVYPVFATSININTLSKQPLYQMNSPYIEIVVAAESGLNKQKIEIPVAWNSVVGIQMKDVQGNWVWIGGTKASSLLTFTKSASYSKEYSSGLSTNYYLYTHNGSTIGARNLRFYSI